MNVKRGSSGETQTSAANIPTRLRCPFVLSRHFHSRVSLQTYLICMKIAPCNSKTTTTDVGMQQLAMGVCSESARSLHPPPPFLFTSPSAPSSSQKRYLSQLISSHSSSPASRHRRFLLDLLLRCPVVEVRAWPDCGQRVLGVIRFTACCTACLSIFLTPSRLPPPLACRSFS